MTSEAKPVRDELLAYYERELTFLRQMGAEFATQYPKVASRLQLEASRCDDPHVERMIESVALLAGRVHLRLDDDFPEITQALLNIVYPHYTRPIPSISVAEFQLREDKLTTSLKVPRDTVLYSRPVDGMPCKFRSCYDTEIWPVRVAEAQWTSLDRLDPPLKYPGAAAALRVRLQCWPQVKFSGLKLNNLRFYLDGEPALVHSLYELLCNNLRSIVVRDPRPRFRQRNIELSPDALRPLGFSEDEAILPYPSRSFSAYRLLQEYFAFPEKFFFFELSGLEGLNTGGFEQSADLIFIISPFEREDRQQLLELAVSPKTFRLGCSPIVNLFAHTAEPIQLDQTKYEFPVAPDFRHTGALEVFSIDDVSCTYEKSGDTVPFEPFYSFRHSTRAAKPTFWHATRRDAGPHAAGGTEMWMALVDLSGQPITLNLDTLTIRCTCTNGDLPARLPFGDENGDFDLEQESAVEKITAVRAPTAPVRPAVGRDALWRLISHLSLNYLSVVEDGREALQEMLRLYHGSSNYMEQQVDGIVSVKSERKFARVVGDHGISYVRGMRVEMELDESKFVGGGVFLFSAVLEHFLAQYVSMNSFSQLAVRTAQRKEMLREWAPKAGIRILL
jgi:type VI secretion system protein ImpG